MPGTYQRIYLDFNASTPVAPEVIDAMRIVLEEPYGNPSSGHWAGSPAREALDKARKAYERALEIEPNNTQIRQNYELFKEINDRSGAAKENP